MKYSIIIPIFNEGKTLSQLLNELESYSNDGHEILIIDDGSNDSTKKILHKCKFIETIFLKKNYGKGIALKVGLTFSKNNKVIIYDGDLELQCSDIQRLMNLDKINNVNYLLGTRFKNYSDMFSKKDFGNFLFTMLYNFLHQTNHKDILCCAKSFYKSDINLKRIKSSNFDIDIELIDYLNKINHGINFKNIYLKYKRRSLEQGKKLKNSDAWLILKRLFINL